MDKLATLDNWDMKFPADIYFNFKLLFWGTYVCGECIVLVLCCMIRNFKQYIEDKDNEIYKRLYVQPNHTTQQVMEKIRGGQITEAV